jgi:hypothetical protein
LSILDKSLQVMYSYFMVKKLTNKAIEPEVPTVLPGIIQSVELPEPYEPQFATRQDINNLETIITRRISDSQEEVFSKIKDKMCPEPTPWYKSSYTYIGIIIFMILCYVLYLFIMSVKGKTIEFPFNIEGIINWIKEF